MVAEPWLLDLLREFSPRVVPLDVDENGGYSEATTRWGMNPVWEAVPAELRDVVEAEASDWSREYWAQLRREES